MHPPREKYRSGTDMSYAIMCTWPIGPRHRAVYTRIYIHVVVDDNRMAILAIRGLTIIVCVVTTTL